MDTLADLLAIENWQEPLDEREVWSAEGIERGKINLTKISLFNQ